MGSGALEAVGSQQFCTECGRPYQAEDLVRFGAATVCAECKPAYIQRLRKGVATRQTPRYAGFWRRFLAVLLDGFIQSIVVLPLRYGMWILAGSPVLPFRTMPFGMAWMGFWSWGTVMAYALEIAYSVYFVSQRGATPGKMIVGAKIVTAHGGAVSVGRAFARYFALYLGWITFGIGFIMAAFDDQKRALHDHICNTRVVLE